MSFGAGSRRGLCREGEALPQPDEGGLALVMPRYARLRGPDDAVALQVCELVCALACCRDV